MIPPGAHLATESFTIECWVKFNPDVDGLAPVATTSVPGAPLNAKSLPHNTLASHTVVLFENTGTQIAVFLTPSLIGFSINNCTLMLVFLGLCPVPSACVCMIVSRSKFRTPCSAQVAPQCGCVVRILRCSGPCV